MLKRLYVPTLGVDSPGNETGKIPTINPQRVTFLCAPNFSAFESNESINFIAFSLSSLEQSEAIKLLVDVSTSSTSTTVG
jgi:hypothetical protein